MTTNTQTLQAPNQSSQPPLSNIPPWIVHAVLVVLVVISAGVSTLYVYNQAVAEQAEEQAEAEEGETVELDFEIEDAYVYWAWALTAFVILEVAYFGIQRQWAFASIVQIGLIILLTLSFLLITQRFERDVYEFGVLALIVFTVVQIIFGNIPPGANFKNSMISLVIGGTIIAAVVGLAIWLTPYLIQIGR